MVSSAVNVHNPNGRHPVVLVCEHASAYFPEQYSDLGLSADDAISHIAWDPGALITARHLSEKLDAILVEGTVSRLIYDLNRPPESPTAMTEQSEGRAVPGNMNLDSGERQQRTDSYYYPFTNTLAATLSGHIVSPVVVTVHSFTPVYNGETRDVEIGILHDADARLADALLDVATGYNIKRNSPYGPEDGVTHTLKLHCLPNGWLNVMIEVSNALIASDAQCVSMANTLHNWLEQALATMPYESSQESRG